jgi:hypothetical protein
MNTTSNYIELLAALQITCIWLFVLSTLGFIRDCALLVLFILMPTFYRCSCTRTRANLQIINRRKLAVFRRGVRAAV